MEEALTRTWETLDARMRLLRLAASAALLIAAACPALSLLLGTPWGLAGFALLLPLGYAFVLSDMRKVFAWEEGMLRLWEAGGLDLDIFVRALEIRPSPLKRALLEMARALPRMGRTAPTEADPGSAGLHRSLSVTRRALAEIRLCRAFCLQACLVCGALSLPALASGPWWGKAGLAAAAGWLLCREAVPYAARRRWEARIRECLRGESGGIRELSARIGELDWGGVPARCKPGFLAAANRLKDPGSGPTP